MKIKINDLGHGIQTLQCGLTSIFTINYVFNYVFNLSNVYQIKVNSNMHLN